MNALEYISATVEPGSPVTEAQVVSVLKSLGFTAGGRTGLYVIEELKIRVTVRVRDSVTTSIWIRQSEQGSLDMESQTDIAMLKTIIKTYKEQAVAYRRATDRCRAAVRKVTGNLPGFHYFDPADLLA